MPSTGFVRFRDTERNTSFAVQINRTDPNAGVCNFVIPTGAQYLGGQASALQQKDEEKLEVHYDGPAQMYSPINDGQDEIITTVMVHINAEIDLKERHATAEIQDDTNNQHFVMVTHVPDGKLQAVEAYEQAIIHQDWAALYAVSSRTTTGAHTEAEFAQLISEQARTVGTITDISLTSEPQVRIDIEAGITFFTVTEQATISLTSLNGASQTQSFTSMFILEDGTWKFLSSSSQ